MSGEGARPRARPERVWAALELELPGPLGEELLVVVGEACLGTRSLPGGGGNERWIAYFEDEAAAAVAARSVEAMARRHGLEAAACGLRCLPVADGRWAERYQSGLRPFAIGRRFTVDPTGGSAADEGRIGLALVPGQAFGTGEHATTRLCVEALEREVTSGTRWVDLGSGSGILAVVAARCGASEVLALDADPLATEVAHEVVARNGVEAVVRVETGSHDAAAGRGWDGVVCNISSDFLLREAHPLAGLLRPGGVCIASGWLAEQREQIEAALAAGTAWEARDTRTLEGWGLWVGARAADAG